ncbi:hypothetical protein KCP76_25225 [Salmonella enterica subsp. enterica serovar Weltevreden]|nr:hypothetical protein KCP76_25225 [Salmonella enterica subsp. enterica serovar Weltevreden]
MKNTCVIIITADGYYRGRKVIAKQSRDIGCLFASQACLWCVPKSTSVIKR